VYTLLLWLVAFNIVNSFNRLVFSALNFLANIVDPILMRIRKVIPSVSGIDLSPLVLILMLTFLKGVIAMMMEALY
jgi:YggT family protein